MARQYPKLGKPARERVSKKISHLVKGENVPQEQAIAMARSMERAGRLRKGGKYIRVKKKHRKTRGGMAGLRRV